MTLPLEQVIADAREEVSILERTGNLGQAEYVSRLLDRVFAAAEDYVTWLTEPEAILKSGLSERTLRRRFRELLESGNARPTARGEREYRSSSVPQRPDVQAQRAAGLAGEPALKRAS